MNTISEMKATKKGIKIRLDKAEDQISNLVDEVVENIQLEQ